MPYTDAQKRQHINEVQRYLHTLSYFFSGIPRIIPDGFYGDETAIAVRAFQRENGLSETGEVNSATWDKIVSIIRGMQQTVPIAYNAFPSPGYILSIGDSGLLVYLVEAMLNSIGASYDNMPAINVNGIYDNATETAVKNFQGHSGLEQNGSVDSNTWNMLVNASEHNNGTLPQTNPPANAARKRNS